MKNLYLFVSIIIFLLGGTYYLSSFNVFPPRRLNHKNNDKKRIHSTCWTFWIRFRQLVYDKEHSRRPILLSSKEMHITVFFLYFFSRLILRVAPLNGLISECLIIQEQRKWHWDLDLVDNNGAIKGLDPSSLSLHEPKRRFDPLSGSPSQESIVTCFSGNVCIHFYLPIYEYIQDMKTIDGTSRNNSGNNNRAEEKGKIKSWTKQQQQKTPMSMRNNSNPRKTSDPHANLGPRQLSSGPRPCIRLRAGLSATKGDSFLPRLLKHSQVVLSASDETLMVWWDT